MPSTSVIIPNYNHGHLIEESILSIYEQSVPPDEIIVIDDGSTDDSVVKLKNLNGKIPILNLIICKENKGPLHAGNIGIQNAKSEIITFRAADDIMPPESIRYSRNAFEEYPQAKIAFGDILFFGNYTSHGTVETLALSDRTEFFNVERLLNLWKPDFNLTEPTCFVKKKSLIEQGGLQEEAKWYSGWLCFTTIALRHGLTFIPKVLSSFRLEPKSYGTSNLRNQKVQRDVLRFLVQQVMSYEQNLKEKFFETGAFTIFGEPLKNLLEEEKDSLPTNSELLLKRELPSDYLLEKFPQHGIPGVITRRLLESMEHLAYLSDLPSPSIWIYGAGTQTLILIEIWKRLPLPPLTGIVVSNSNGRSKFMDLPMVAINSNEDLKVDLFVLSSKSFELEMSARLEESYPFANKLSFWVKELTCLPLSRSHASVKT